MSTSNPTAMPTRPSRVGITISAFVLAAVIAGGGLLYASVARIADSIPTPEDFATVVEPQPYLDISPAIVRSVQQMAELTTVEMTEFTIVEKGTDEGWLEWARGDSVRLMAVANIGAGVNLAEVSAADFSVSPQGVVEVTLPHAEILYVAVDPEATQILERDKGLFTKGDPQLETEARQVAETVLTDAALEQGILSDAESSARLALSNLLSGLGYADVIVVFD